ncbi:acid phosphatase [Paenibacillus sp. 19GGS1-52]|nr:acid phosphatase [Paenibacillus sp. 19GGS1-52]
MPLLTSNYTSNTFVQVAKGLPVKTVDHIVVVVEENHSYKKIVGSSKAPYMQSLIKQGALFTKAYAVTHPSQPNYLALFSGSTQNVTDDSCKGPFSGGNLASELKKAGLTFTGYSENLPKTGYTGCSTNVYARKHNPWAQFSNVPTTWNRPLTDFPKDFSKLPTVSFVIPNVKDDMHDGTIEEADTWLKKYLGGYAAWAQEHNSLLIVTWDEDDFTKENRIPVIFVGQMIKPGTYSDKITHYRVLRTIEDLYHLSPLGHSSEAKAITSVWK